MTPPNFRLKTLILLTALIHSMSVIDAVPLTSKRSISVAKSQPSSSSRVVFPTDIAGSNAETWEDDDDDQLESAESTRIAGNQTDSDVVDDLSRMDVDSFVVRLARALQHMNFVNVPKTVVLNKPECIEHTHTDEEPALFGPRSGHFADNNEVGAPADSTNLESSSAAQSVASAPNKRPKSHSKNNVWRSKHSYGNIGGHGGPASMGSSCCTGKNVYNGPVILISNVRDLKLVNPQPGSDFGDGINSLAGDAGDDDDSVESREEPADASIKNDPDNSIDLGDII